MILPTLDFEKKYWAQGLKYVCGLDEVGRGCFAGPVVVGAVIFPVDIVLPLGVADSKLLTPKKREILSEQIKKVALDFTLAEVEVEVINQLGIGQATQIAFQKAVKALRQQPDFLLIDAFFIQGIDRNIQNPIVKGDQSCASISAASIIAKVYRDKLMIGLDSKYPEYGFAKHKGYGTKDHQAAIKNNGFCKIHRKSFNLGKFLY